MKSKLMIMPHKTLEIVNWKAKKEILETLKQKVNGKEDKKAKVFWCKASPE